MISAHVARARCLIQLNRRTAPPPGTPTPTRAVCVLLSSRAPRPQAKQLVLHNAISALGQAGDVRGTQRLFQLLRDAKRHTTYTWGVLFLAFAASDRLDLVASHFERACRGGEDVGPVGASCLIKIASQRRDLDMALDLYYKMRAARTTFNRCAVGVGRWRECWVFAGTCFPQGRRRAPRSTGVRWGWGGGVRVGCLRGLAFLRRRFLGKSFHAPQPFNRSCASGNRHAGLPGMAGRWGRAAGPCGVHA